MAKYLYRTCPKCKGPKRVVLLLSLIVVLFTACKGYDSDFIPYLMKGLDVWVYDDNTDREFYAGQVKANYWNRKEALSSCNTYAHSLAREKGLRNWSYVCCTVTSSSNCVTKVR